MQSHFSKTISNFKLTFSFITLLNDIDSTTELSNQSTMDGHQISDIDFRVLVGINNQSSAVPEPRMNVFLPILTEHDVQTEIESVPDGNSFDIGNFVLHGMLPAYLFPGPTRTIQRKNRAIESIASKLGKVGSEMYSTNQEIDDHIIVCCRCDTALESKDLKDIGAVLKCHEGNCQGRNYCPTCFTIYAGPFRQRGLSLGWHTRKVVSRSVSFNPCSHGYLTQSIDRCRMFRGMDFVILVTTLNDLVSRQQIVRQRPYIWTITSRVRIIVLDISVYLRY